MEIAIGGLVDGIPESIVIGPSLLKGRTPSMVPMVSIFLSTISEELSGAAGMKRAAGSPATSSAYGRIAFAARVAAPVGYPVFQGFSLKVVAATTAIAAGAILAMLGDTMIPDAFEVAHMFAGLVTVAGFLTAFMLTKTGSRWSPGL